MSGQPPVVGNAGFATAVAYLSKSESTPVPRIIGGHMVVQGRRTSDFVLQFNVPMDPATVQNTAAYTISDTTPHFASSGLYPFSGYSPVPPIASATYDPAANTVDLHLAKSVDVRDVYSLDQMSNGNVLLKSAAGTTLNDDHLGASGEFGLQISNKKTTFVSTP